LDPFDPVELRVAAAQAALTAFFVAGGGSPGMKQVAPVRHLDFSDCFDFGLKDVPHPARDAEIFGGKAEQAQAPGEIELRADAAEWRTMSGCGRLLHPRTPCECRDSGH